MDPSWRLRWLVTVCSAWMRYNNSAALHVFSVSDTGSFVLTGCANAVALSAVSECFSPLTALSTSSNPLTRVKGNALVSNQVEL